MEKTIEMVGSKVLCKREVLKLARAEILELNLPFCALGDFSEGRVLSDLTSFFVRHGA